MSKSPKSQKVSAHIKREKELNYFKILQMGKWVSNENLCSKMRFSAFNVELLRDSDKTFNLSTCNKNGPYYNSIINSYS